MNWNTSSSNFKPHPSGSFFAICVDVYDRVEKNNFYGKPNNEGKIDNRETTTVAYIEFFTDQGETVRFKANATLGKADKPSNLRKFIKGWNAKISDAQLDAFNPELLLGWPAYITVAHRESKGNTYANVTLAMQPPPSSPIPNIPASFIRNKDKGTAQPIATGPSQAAQPAPAPVAVSNDSEDDLQF